MTRAPAKSRRMTQERSHRLTLREVRSAITFFISISKRVRALHQEAHPEVGEQHDPKASHAEEHRGPSHPPGSQSCMEIEGVIQPKDARPDLFGGPEPVCAPGEIGP